MLVFFRHSITTTLIFCLLSLVMVGCKPQPNQPEAETKSLLNVPESFEKKFECTVEWNVAQLDCTPKRESFKPVSLGKYQRINDYVMDGKRYKMGKVLLERGSKVTAFAKQTQAINSDAEINPALLIPTVIVEIPESFRDLCAWENGEIGHISSKYLDKSCVAKLPEQTDSSGQRCSRNQSDEVWCYDGKNYYQK